MSRGLPYISLPPQINLGDPKYSNFYNQASYNLHSSHVIKGNTIYFSYTIPVTVRNSDGAIALADFLISPKGKMGTKETGLNPINAVAQGDPNSMPPNIKSLIK